MNPTTVIRTIGPGIINSTSHSPVSLYVILYILIALLGFFVIILCMLLGCAIWNCVRMVHHEPVNKVVYYITV